MTTPAYPFGNFANAVANDYKIVDGIETVTLTQAGVATTVTYASRDSLNDKEVMGSNGFWQYGDQRWALGRNQVARQPLGGDTITDGQGIVWELIGDSTLDDFGISWNCVVRKAR